MPELPDLEVFKANIFTRLTSKKLVSYHVFNSRKVSSPENTDINELINSQLISIDRIGKELYWNFGEDKILSTHLMLKGEIAIVPKEDVSDIKFKIFSLSFEEETVVFSDPGGLCTIKYKPIVDEVPDALSDEFSLPYLRGVLNKKSRSNIKALLIDQKLIKGIGNAYADEILWEAKISPKSLAGKIPEDKISILYNAVRTVLQSAIKSIKEISPGIISGEERSFLKVHNKNLTNTESGFCIMIEKVASKTTYYTEEQIEYS